MLVAVHVCLVHRPPSPAGPSVYHLVPSCSFSRRVWQRSKRKAYAGDGGVVEKAAVYGKALKQEPCFIIT